MLSKILLCILLPIAVLCADPWGKDADLATSPCSVAEVKRTKTPLNSLMQVFIGFHQETISKADGPRSHYYPSSSQYTLEAIRKYGLLQGIPMGCDRLMRENEDPWVYRRVYHHGVDLKYNPVP